MKCYACPAPALDGSEYCPEHGAPNLDSMFPSDLQAWIAEHPVGSHETLFGRRYRAATALRILRRYARLKLASIAYRERGKVASAEATEAQCERLCDALPPWGKW